MTDPQPGDPQAASGGRRNIKPVPLLVIFDEFGSFDQTHAIEVERRKRELRDACCVPARMLRLPES